MLKIRTIKPSASTPQVDLALYCCDAEALSKLYGRKSARVKHGPTLPSLNAELKGAPAAELKRRGFEAKNGQSAVLTLFNHDSIGTAVVVGWDAGGDSSRFDRVHAARRLGHMLGEFAEKLRAKTVLLAEGGPDLGDALQSEAFLEGLLLSSYRFESYKSKSETRFKGIEEIEIVSSKRSVEKALARAIVICDATTQARDLVNMPPLDCTPAHLVKRAKEVAKRGKLEIKVFDREALKRIGAGGLLAVSQGSDQPPYLIRLSYKPRGRRGKILGLVGKGVTFDSGGLSIKTAGGMETMKCDMAGAAAVLSAMQAVAHFKPRFEVRAYIPATENMIAGSATRPGDVIKALNGKSIEVLNTDAEGRLILADALALAEKEGCDTLVDLATLTGACMVALGTDYAGLFCADPKLREKLQEAAENSGERLWSMPLAPEYKENIKSPVADIKNTGGPYGGAITAALFLKEFVKTDKWAHLDIAGPAFADSAKGILPRGGTGFGVRTLVRFICG